MSFAAGGWLAALILLPLALLLRRLRQRRARRYALRFSAAASLARAAGEDRPGRWRAQLPAAVMLLGAGVLVLALARPQITVRLPVPNAEIVLVLDHSGSMASTDIAPSRIGAAIEAGNRLISGLPAEVRVGFVGFGSTPDVIQAPVRDHAVTRRILDAQLPGGATDTGPALQDALALLHGSTPHHPPAAVVLLSDGAANVGVSPVTVAAQARRERIPIDTVALGTPNGVLDVGPFNQPIPVPPDPALMAAIARTSGGRSFTARTAGELSSIYSGLGSQLGSVPVARSIAPEVLLLAGGLLLIGLLAGVRTRARVA
jgi:Ca-activated chloride channel family protein